MDRAALWRRLHGIALVGVGGFVGAFTTFSTFALETVRVAERGEPLRAAGFAVVNLLVPPSQWSSARRASTRSRSFCEPAVPDVVDRRD